MKAKLTLKDWKAKYYPVPANSKEAKRDPIGHSLRKWRGLRERVLERYDLVRRGQEISDRDFWTLDYITIGSLSCALCEVYQDYTAPRPKSCKTCPLSRSLGKPCDDSDEGDDSPYLVWKRTGDPEPMIAALVKTRQKYGKKATK